MSGTKLAKERQHSHSNKAAATELETDPADNETNDTLQPYVPIVTDGSLQLSAEFDINGTLRTETVAPQKLHCQKQQNGQGFNATSIQEGYASTTNTSNYLSRPTGSTYTLKDDNHQQVGKEAHFTKPNPTLCTEIEKSTALISDTTHTDNRLDAVQTRSRALKSAQDAQGDIMLGTNATLIPRDMATLSVDQTTLLPTQPLTLMHNLSSDLTTLVATSSTPQLTSQIKTHTTVLKDPSSNSVNQQILLDKAAVNDKAAENDGQQQAPTGTADLLSNPEQTDIRFKQEHGQNGEHKQ